MSYAFRLRLAAACFLAGCVTVPSGPPDQLAAEVLAAIDEERVDDARALFEPVSGDASYREKMFPILFEGASQRFEAGDTAASTRVLRFMDEGWPDARGVDEALVYSLFLERARASEADPTVSAEIESALADLTAEGAPVWVDLIRAQNAIDRGRLGEAREDYERFLTAWNGEPPALEAYVEDVGRFLASH